MRDQHLESTNRLHQMSPNKKPTAWEEAVINYKTSKAYAAYKEPNVLIRRSNFFSKHQEREQKIKLQVQQLQSAWTHSKKCNVTVPSALDIVPIKGWSKRDCTLIWQSESKKQALPKPQMHDMTIVTKIRSIGPTHKPAKWEIPRKNNKARHKIITINRLGQTKCELAK